MSTLSFQEWLTRSNFGYALLFAALLSWSSCLQADDDRQFPILGSLIEDCQHLGTMISEFEALASNGNMDAAYCLGRTHEINGYKDFGLKWLRTATELGSIEAQWMLAGILLGADRKTATELVLNAAMRGHRMSQLLIATQHYNSWKDSGDDEQLLKSWAWLQLTGNKRIGDVTETPAKTVDLDALLSSHQREMAENILREMRQNIAQYPQVPPKLALK